MTQRYNSASPYMPIYELTRAKTVESVHSGAAVVVDVYGKVAAWYGSPDAVTFLRSTAKPFQALPFIEHGGHITYDLSWQEIAATCASHSGTDEHVAIVQSLQVKCIVLESELLCGVHPPLDKSTAEELRKRGEQPTPNRHNCSGKHTGMLALVRLKERSGVQFADDLEYIDPAHPVQREILGTFAEMCKLPVEQVRRGIDNCSAPNFAAPIRNVAHALARLCDPETGGVLPDERAVACRTIVSAMISNPFMVEGPERFDTRLMEVAQGRIVSKGGAEGYQGVGLMPGALGPGSPAIGIATKIADGDALERVRSAVTLEVLRQLGALSASELQALSDFGPRSSILNWRKVLVGEAYPTFVLNRDY